MIPLSKIKSKNLKESDVIVWAFLNEYEDDEYCMVHKRIELNKEDLCIFLDILDPRGNIERICLNKDTRIERL